MGRKGSEAQLNKNPFDEHELRLDICWFVCKRFPHKLSLYLSELVKRERVNSLENPTVKSNQLHGWESFSLTQSRKKQKVFAFANDFRFHHNSMTECGAHSRTSTRQWKLENVWKGVVGNFLTFALVRSRAPTQPYRIRTEICLQGKMEK